jgi:hypothetical protein
MSRLAICAIFKNEAAFLLEWIAYHRVVGFDHFYLYDNDSTDGGGDLIRQSNLAPYVTVIQWPPRPGQLPAYRHFIDHHAQACDWAAFIDLDEFLLPLQERSVRPLLDRIPTASAVLVQWRVFGPSGWQQRPEGLVIDNYTMRTADNFSANKHVKTIVRCADLLDITDNPHQFRLRADAANPLGRTIPNIPIQETPCHEALVINHYQTRSHQDWFEKLGRGRADTDKEEMAYRSHLIRHYEEMSTVLDETIRSFSDAVRETLIAAPASEPEQPEVAAPPLAAEADWTPQGDGAWRHRDGLALVYRDNGRPGLPWLGALRRTAAGLVDPTFLTDPYGHIRTFPSDQEAIDACDAVLEKKTGKQADAATAG